MEIKDISMAQSLRLMRGVEGIQPPKISPTEGPKPGQKSFSDFLSQQVQTVNELGLDSERHMQGVILGTEENPHDSVIAMAKADIAFHLMMTVKERIEQAYQQLVRTQIG